MAAVARDVLRHVARPATAAEHTPQQLTQRARVSGSAGSWLHCLSGSPCVARSWASRGWLQTCMYDLAGIVFCRHMLITSSTAAPDFCLIIYRRLPLISCGEHPLSTPSWGRCLVHVGAAAEPDGNRDVRAGNGRQRQAAADSGRQLDRTPACPSPLLRARHAKYWHCTPSSTVQALLPPSLSLPVLAQSNTENITTGFSNSLRHGLETPTAPAFLQGLDARQGSWRPQACVPQCNCEAPCSPA